jgi:hypothetical protein
METFSNILLNEGARDRALEMFLPYFQKRGMNITISQLKQALLAKFVNEAGMHNLSLESNFYLVGVARYYFNGDLTTNKQLNILYPRVKDRFNPQVCQRLDALVEILRNAYVDSVGTKWEQPEDFGKLTIQQLLKKYNSKINKALGIDTKPEVPAEVPQISQDYTAGKNYTYEILYSYEDAKKYNRATEPGAWCITYGKQHYDGYIRRLKIHYVVFKQNGYEGIPRKVGPGFTKRKPHDAYGNSLICVLQSNSSARPVYITSRWNHGSYHDGTSGTEADHAYTTEEFLQVIGCDSSVLDRAFEQWKTNMESSKVKAKDRTAMRADRLNAMRQLKYAQMMINGGADPFSIQYLRLLPVDGYEGNKPNPKGLYWVEVSVNDEESFVTFMDRKKIMFDKFLVSSTAIGGGHYMSHYRYNMSDKYIAFRKADDSFLIYDRMRRQFVDLGGIINFKYGSSQFTSSYDTKGYKYGIVAMSGNQLALINLETLKPVKARNGSPWFETITANNTNQTSNSDYRGHIQMPYMSIDGNILHLVYDSASGEEYFFNTRTDSFIDNRGIPEDFVQIQARTSDLLPNTNYVMFIKKGCEKMNRFGAPICPMMFKNADDGSIFSIKGKTVFLDFERKDDVIGFRPIDEEVAYYGDIKANKFITLNGQPVTTKYRVALQRDSVSGYYEISQSRWYKVEEGPYKGEITYGDFYKAVLLYNPYTQDFYHDEKNAVGGNGYLFNVYGGGYITPPGANKNWSGISGKENAIANGWLVKIPSAREMAESQTVKVESRNTITSILREEIEKLIKNIK